MAEHPCVDALRIERKRFGVAPLDFLIALDHAAVDQVLTFADAQQMR